LVAPPLTFPTKRRKTQPQQAATQRLRKVAVSGINRKPGGLVRTRLSSIFDRMLPMRFASRVALGFKNQGAKTLKSGEQLGFEKVGQERHQTMAGQRESKAWNLMANGA